MMKIQQNVRSRPRLKVNERCPYVAIVKPLTAECEVFSFTEMVGASGRDYDYTDLRTGVHEKVVFTYAICDM